MSKISIPFMSPEKNGVHPVLEDTAEYLLDISNTYIKPSRDDMLCKAWELFRFLCIRAVYGDNVSPSGILDDVWHSVILDTVLYQRLCRLVIDELQSENLCGVSHNIISHSKLASLDSSEMKDKRYKEGCMVYKMIYGKPIDRKLWPDLRAPPRDPLGSRDGC